jgi:hypothetical protein
MHAAERLILSFRPCIQAKVRLVSAAHAEPFLAMAFRAASVPGIKARLIDPPRFGFYSSLAIPSLPHKEGIGLSIELKAFPIDGRLVVLPPDTDDGNNGRNGK